MTIPSKRWKTWICYEIIFNRIMHVFNLAENGNLLQQISNKNNLCMLLVYIASRIAKENTSITLGINIFSFVRAISHLCSFFLATYSYYFIIMVILYFYWRFPATRIIRHRINPIARRGKKGSNLNVSEYRYSRYLHEMS